ncbi:MAG TPA: hypothetical protein VNT03_06715 [Baekduia sp.]|nr:hypothetical protein [Baekduia sp.]
MIKDCADGSIDKSYSQKDYADALANIPADLDEYTDCRSQIQRKQLGGSGGSGSSNDGGGGTSGGATGGGSTGTGGGSGSAAGGDTGASGGGQADPLAGATDAERVAFAKAVESGAAPVHLDGRPIYPGELGGARSSGLSDLPAPLLAILALLVLAGVGAAGLGTRRLVLGRRTA